MAKTLVVEDGPWSQRNVLRALRGSVTMAKVPVINVKSIEYYVQQASA